MPSKKANSAQLPTRLQLIRNIRAFRPVLNIYRVDAATVVGTALRLWSRRVYPKLRASRLPWSLKLENAQELQSLVGFLERLPFCEAAYWLSTVYSALTEDVYRKQYALYFTPPQLANRLIADLTSAGVRFDADRFIDPACGGAAFLAIIAERMRLALKAKGLSARAILSHASTHLSGVDLDPVLGALSRHFLRMVFYPEICASWNAVRFDIACRDSLRSFQSRKGKFDVVLCNPPFRKLSAIEASTFRHKALDSIDAQPNLYTLFIELTASLVRPGGLVGLVTPTSFMSGQYFRQVRTFLLKNTHVVSIGVVTDRDRVYLDVEQETALTVFRAGPSASQARASTVISLVEPSGKYHVVGHCRLPNSGTSWPIARSPLDVKLIESASRSPFRLSDYGYSVSIGSYVWNRDARTVFLTARHVPKAKRNAAIPLLWSSDVCPGGALRFERHGSQENQHRFIDQGQEQIQGVRRRPGVLLQRVTSNDQPRRLVGAVISAKFIRKYGGYMGENHTVILEQATSRPIFSAREMVTLLASDVVDRYFRSISGSTNVSAFELGQLPLPNPAALRKKLDGGASIDTAAASLLTARCGKRRA